MDSHQGTKKVILDSKIQASQFLWEGFRHSDENVSLSTSTKFGNFLSIEMKQINALNLSFRKKHIDARKQVCFS